MSKLTHHGLTFVILLTTTVLLITCRQANCDEAGGSDDLDLTLVETGLGSVSGIPLVSRRGRTYYGFLGVPYGKIKERFAVGEKADSWEGVKEVKTLPPPCFHYFVMSHQMVGVEDCLQLNVYSPKPKTGTKMPVFVWFSPGGFQFGGASLFEGKYVMDQDAVFVTINFRMGALGFLNTGEGTIPANNGLKDAVLALKWVQENIDKFGGDPNLVTIIGLSAGGALTDYLTISPMAKGLFHRAVAMSGLSLNPWAFQPHPVQTAETFAEHAGCSMADWGWVEKVACLRTKEPSAIANAQLKLMKLGFDFDFLHMKFVPSVESEAAPGPKFLTDTPFALLSRGEIASKVPLMTGHTENEGAFFVANVLKTEKLWQKVSSDWSHMAPYMLYYEDRVTPLVQGRVSKQIHDFYFGGRPISPETRKGYTDAFSDRYFNNGVAKGIQVHATGQQEVYPYIMDFQGQHSFILSAFGAKDKEGFSHADDLIFLFNRTLGMPEAELGTREGEFSEKLWTLLVSFAKDGKPTATWGPQKEWPIQGAGADRPVTYYKLDLEDTRLLDDPFAPRRQFWDQLPIKEHAKVGMDDPKEEL